MDLNLLRMRLHRWRRQPVGFLAVMMLALGVALANIPRIEVHSHAHGDAPHVTHEHHHDGDAAPGHHDDQHNDQHDDGNAVLHVHSTAVAATVIPSMTHILPVTLVPAAAPPARLVSAVRPSRPAEHFRPPIA